MTGALVLVATPIGNLGDLAPRAVETLANADLVACEDTRRTGRLLAHAGITGARLMTVNEHNEADAARVIVDRVASGERVAVVTDAGMPGISDPGERLVRAVVDADLTVEVVPGPSAAIAALVVSGLPAGRFVFEGFLPRKGRARSTRLQALATEERTIVLHESPHRLLDTLEDLALVMGAERPVAVIRELSKLHEEVWRGSLGDAAGVFAEVRGEVVIVVQGAPPPGEPDDDQIVAALRTQLDSGSSTRDAVAAVVDGLGVPKRRVYDLATGLARGSGG